MNRRTLPRFLSELKQFGAVGAQKCIQCGACTAICSLSSDADRFPRYLVRLAQLGLKDELLGSKELWLCYNCGACSETCPQQAEPANLMAAARSYAIAHYSPLRIGSLFTKRPLWGGLLTVLLAGVVAAFLYSQHQSAPTDALRLFGFVPYPLIHDVGLAAMILVGGIGVATVFTMLCRIARAKDLRYAELLGGSPGRLLRALWQAVGVEALGQRRYRTNCATTQDAPAWFLTKWFVHAATMWGFFGLLLATSLDYLLDILGVKATGTLVPLWYPTRLIGTLSGLLFVYGVSLLMVRRYRALDKAYSNSCGSDWIFLILLFVSGVTGFAVEVALYLPGAPIWGYAMFIFHVAVSITLLLVLPFTKFAHVLYRTVALYLHALGPVANQEQTAQQGENS